MMLIREVEQGSSAVQKEKRKNFEKEHEKVAANLIYPNSILIFKLRG
jgi:hypothetical protein